MRLLQQEEYTPVQALAEQIGLSKRQIERILASLGEMGIPLQSVHARGYRIAPQPNGVPVHLTNAELWALMLLPRFGLKGLGEGARCAIESLTHRVARHLSEKTQARINEMSSLVAVSASGDELPKDVWETLTQALHQNLQLAFDYHPLQPTDLIHRRVEPWGLFSLRQVWYLHAYDLDRQAARNFRLTRIRAARLLGFPAERPNGYSAQQGLFHAWTIGTGELQEVVVECSPVLTAWLQENPVHPEQRWEGQRVTFSINNRPYFLAWLLSQRGARLVSPVSMHAELLALLQQRQEELFSEKSVASERVQC
jgi:predicted DNA-binding transcriptional regulator YafY